MAGRLKYASTVDDLESGDPQALMPHLRSIHKMSDFPTGSGPEDWGADKQPPTKVKESDSFGYAATGPNAGDSAYDDGPVVWKPGKLKQAAGTVPGVAEQYYLDQLGKPGISDDSMPLELVGLAGPQAAQGASMAQLAGRLVDRKNAALVASGAAGRLLKAQHIAKSPLEKVSGERWLYHGTPRENEEAIDKEGLRIGNETKVFSLARRRGRFVPRTDVQKGSVHLAENPLYAGAYGQSDKNSRLIPNRPPLVYAIKVNDEDVVDKGVETAHLPFAQIKSRAFLHTGNIDPSRIRKIDMPSLEEILLGKEKKAYTLQGKMDVQGLPISIENRKGSVRSGTDSDGNAWSIKMKHPYGYIRGTRGADGDPVDAYVGPDKEAPDAFVVHQRKDDGTGYDEDKVMLGFRNKAEAKAAYLAHYDDPKFLGPISKVSVERLKELVASKRRLVKISSAQGKALLEELMSIQKVGEAPKKTLGYRIRKAGPGIGGLLGAGVGAALGKRKGKLLHGALAGLGTGATLGWVPDMAHGIKKAVT